MMTLIMSMLPVAIPAPASSPKISEDATAATKSAEAAKVDALLLLQKHQPDIITI